MKYRNKPNRWRFMFLGAKLLSLSALSFSVSGVIFAVQIFITAWIAKIAPQSIWTLLMKIKYLSMGCGIALLVAGVLFLMLPKTMYLTWLVKRTLFDPAYGNPLRLQENQCLPDISCCKKGSPEQVQFELTIWLKGGFTSEQIKGLASAISPALTGKVKNYAVTAVQEDDAHNYVNFIIEDVTIDHRLVFSSVNEMIPHSMTKLLVDKRTSIDLRKSGSIICAGKTRSGKTTGIIALLLQALLCGPDQHNSEVLIIDPKRAELSHLPHTVTVDEDGGGRAILAAVQRFADSITVRQGVLNVLSEVDGNAIHWWEAAMYPSFLVLDEFVSLRTLFPKRGESLMTFDALLKRIVTMGASAGCYVIISIAEASVEEGGLPAMLRSAMSTRILFRPTIPEARLLWNTEKLRNMPDRVYGPGEAWFSSADGVHDEVSFIRFPQMNFPIYRELGRLLTEYYSDAGAGGGGAASQAPAPPKAGLLD